MSRPQKVLIISSYAVDVQITTRVLEHYFQPRIIHAAYDIRRAEILLIKNRYELVITNYGIEQDTAEVLEAYLPPHTLVDIPSYDDDRAKRWAGWCGFGIIEKPYQPEDLFNKINELLEIRE